MSASPSVESYGPRLNTLVPLPAGERGVAIVTAGSPCGKFLIYCNGTNVIVRDAHNPAAAMVYAEHGSQGVKAAKFSPSGKYIASGGAARRRAVRARARAGG
jgi:uncharacterized protein with WD repeat